MRILHVDDAETNRFLIRAYLKKEQVIIDEALHGREAVEKYIEVSSNPLEQPYSLIFMDMKMPVMDGYQATRAIRAWETSKGKQPVKIYSLTARALIDDEKKCIDAGCDKHLTKPIKKQNVLDIVCYNDYKSKVVIS